MGDRRRGHGHVGRGQQVARVKDADDDFSFAAATTPLRSCLPRRREAALSRARFREYQGWASAVDMPGRVRVERTGVDSAHVVLTASWTPGSCE